MTPNFKGSLQVPIPHIQSELLFPLKIGKVRGTSSSNPPCSVDAWELHYSIHVNHVIQRCKQ